MAFSSEIRGAVSPQTIAVLTLALASGCSSCRGNPAPDGAASTPSSAAATAPSAAIAPAPPAAGIPSGVRGDPSGILHCCVAIRRNLALAPAAQRPAWDAAARACDDIADAGAGRDALQRVRDLLRDVGYPADCR